jgi:hypothetical protein
MMIFLGMLCLIFSGCQLKSPAVSKEAPRGSDLGTNKWEKQFTRVGKLFGDVTLVPSDAGTAKGPGNANKGALAGKKEVSPGKKPA